MKNLGTLERWLLTALFILLGGWTAMLAIGVAHAEILPELHPCGFWPATTVALLIGLTVICFKIADEV